jgi:Tol biopolymer transport system component
MLEQKDGALPIRVLHGSGRGEGVVGLAMAPDGKLLYTLRTERSRGIWEMSIDGSDQREIVPPESEFESVQINVTPDNRYLVFESDRGGSTEIWRANRDGSGAIALTSGDNNTAPVLTPDGQTVLYASRRSGTYSITSIPITGGSAQQLTTFDCSWPDISRDGNHLACVTGTASDAAKRKLVIYDLSENRQTTSLDLAVNAAPFNRIRFSPDGGSIIYKDIVDGLWKQSVGGGKPEKLPGFEDERVFHFNFSNDGDLIYSGGVQMRQIVVIENFK